MPDGAKVGCMCMDYAMHACIRGMHARACVVREDVCMLDVDVDV